ncbi:hypothetical protein PGQ11_014898 [Apiospora arundinis]|uniref:Chromo domain-containing protein n=1 Tax=Apiospora arundinis TaxID=335852 RepID=A0ABR2HKB5_9PEZI
MADSNADNHRSKTAVTAIEENMMHSQRVTRSKTTSSSTTSFPSSASSNAHESLVQRSPSKRAAARHNPLLPGVERQSMRIAIANSIEADRLHKLANPSADGSNTANKITRPNTGRRASSSVSPSARGTTRFPRAAVTTTPSSPGGTFAANNQDQGTPDNTGNTKKKDRYVKTKNMAQAGLGLSRGIPAERHGYYCIKDILAEATRNGTTQYLVEWDGINPSTGIEWPADWVGASDLSKTALQAWEVKKAKNKGKPAMN